MGRTIRDGLWIETDGSKAEIGVTAELLKGGKLTKIETVGKNAKLAPGGAFLLLTLGKKKEVEIASPVRGKLREVRPELAKAVTAVATVLEDPEHTWIVRVDLDAAAAEDEDEDDEDGLDDDLGDDEDDDE